MNAYRKKYKRLAAAVLVLTLLLCQAVPAMAESFSAIVTAQSMAVYGDAAMSQKLGALSKNTVVRVTGYSSAIARISYRGQSGYAKVSDMSRVEDVATKAVTNAAAQVYQSPQEDSAKVKVPAGTRVYVLGKSDEWAQVEKGGAVGYIKLRSLEDADENWNTASATATEGTTVSVQPTQENGITVRTYSAVATETTKIYKSASVKAKVKATLRVGVQVTVLATSSNGWAYVTLNGKRGYCQLKYLKEGVAEDYTPAPTLSPSATAQAGTPGVVSVASLNVYQDADENSALLGTLKQGKQVNVIRWNKQWAYIELSGRYGYCAVLGLSKVGGEATATPTFSPDLVNAKKATATRTLTVYQTAGAKGKKLGTLKKGKTVNLIQSSDGWAYIELNGNYGFCSADGLSVDKEQEGLPAGYKKLNVDATVVTGDARAYASPNTDSESVALKRGAEVQVIGYKNSWACVKQDGNYAFVMLKALSKASYSPISGDGTQLQTLLKALLSGGYYDDVPSTSYNAAAIAAIKRFQSACGMEQTGVADQNMLRIVYSGYAPVSSLLYTTLSKGDKNDSVSRVQARLYALGYLSKTASLDGEYGSTTVAAIKLFQNASGISATGTANSATLKALYNPEAKKLPSGTKAADASSSGGSSSGSSTYLNEVPRGLASTTTTYQSGMSNAEKLEHAIYLAQTKLGCPYVYGATGPAKFDCSGLTVYIFKAIDVSLKRTAYNQGYDETYTKIEGWKNLKRGDVVFFNTISDSDLSDHAGVYIGDGYFIHASSGAHKVVVSNLSTGFYGRVFSWGRRILK